MKKILLLLPALLSAIFSFGNFYSIDWIRTADSYLKSGAMLTRDNADNVISTGYTPNASIYTQKYDKFGKFLWERSSSSDVHSNYERSIWVNVDSQRNIYVTGYRYTISTQPPFQFVNAIIVLKYGPSGNLLWKFILPGTFTLNPPFNTSLIRIRSEVDANGNIYVGTSGQITGNSIAGFVLIKINPRGNMVWTRTHNFSTQHGFLSMRLRDKFIVLTGSSAPNYQNVSSVMYDTSGIKKWNATTSGYGGQDVELDDVGNAYILTWNFDEVSAGSDGDIVVIQYNTAGVQLKRHKYDFGGTEYARKITRTGTNGLAIIGTGVPPGGFFISWLVMKINFSGALQWSKVPFNNGPYDDYPYNLIGNSKGEVFVTGSKQNGKPFPGYYALTTNKYLSNGTPDWSAQYDSTASKGLAVVLANNGSIYVLGESFATVIHYFDHTGTGSCGIPGSIAAGNIQRNAATISYTKTTGAIVYHIQYKAAGSPLWTTISTNKNSYLLNGLTPGTTYEYRVEAVCKTAPSGYSAIKQFTTPGTSYCSTGGADASNDWIDLVWIGSLQSSTWNNNGYADLTHMNTSLVRGATVTGYLSATFSNASYPVEYFRVWIDYNIDGDFNDAGEKVIDTSTSSLGLISVSFVVPVNAKAGTARMRVTMRNGAAPPPCGTYPFGETEDYSAVIQASAVNAEYAGDISKAIDSKGALKLIPNPAANVVQLKHTFNIHKPIQVQVLNMHGEVVLSQQLIKSTIDVSRLTTGIYMVHLMQANRREVAKLMVVR